MFARHLLPLRLVVEKVGSGSTIISCYVKSSNWLVVLRVLECLLPGMACMQSMQTGKWARWIKPCKLAKRVAVSHCAGTELANRKLIHRARGMSAGCILY